jgi:rare lipoprotein A
VFLAVTACLLFGPGCAKKTVYQGGAPRPEVPAPSRPQPQKTQKTYTVLGQTYTPVHSAANYTETGIASWYGEKFHGRLTASGEVYNMYQQTAAHRILPMQTRLKVTNLDNGRTTQVRVNDRGPFVKNRILDLSYQAAKDLGVVGPGTARVRIEAEGTPAEGFAGPFYIQVGSFTIKDNALNLRDKMREQGYTQSRIHPITLDEKTFWQVHAGIFTTMTDAQEELRRLSAQTPSSFILAD